MSEKKKMGRPPIWDESLASEVCARIASGRSLRSVTQDKGMPSMQTVFRWMGQYENFRNQYAQACEERADYLAEEALSIADDDATDHGKVQRDRLRVDTRKWFVSKIHPKKYSERIQQEDITAKPKQLVIVRELSKGED